MRHSTVKTRQPHVANGSTRSADHKSNMAYIAGSTQAALYVTTISNVNRLNATRKNQTGGMRNFRCVPDDTVMYLKRRFGWVVDRRGGHLRGHVVQRGHA